jgi:hypothetical protein
MVFYEELQSFKINNVSSMKRKSAEAVGEEILIELKKLK